MNIVYVLQQFVLFLWLLCVLTKYLIDINIQNLQFLKSNIFLNDLIGHVSGSKLLLATYISTYRKDVLFVLLSIIGELVNC